MAKILFKLFNILIIIKFEKMLKYLSMLPLSSKLSWNEWSLKYLTPKSSSKTRVIAVGDSITWGSCSSDPKSKAWPVKLMDMLWDSSKYEVINLGVGGRTMMKKGDWPYWQETQYKWALQSEADVVVLMLGTNDSKNY